MGIIVSKKVGKAVVRNRVRRRLREALRLRLRRGELRDAAVDLVIVARPSAAEASYAELDRSLGSALDRAGLR